MPFTVHSIIYQGFWQVFLSIFAVNAEILLLKIFYYNKKYNGRLPQSPSDSLPHHSWDSLERELKNYLKKSEKSSF
jgi:hypothetical protein